MKAYAIIGTTLAATLLTAGCDNILGIDNYDAPDTLLTGQVLFQGQPAGIRTNAIQLLPLLVGGGWGGVYLFRCDVGLTPSPHPSPASGRGSYARPADSACTILLSQTQKSEGLK
jgi:hypothetical protein